MIRSSALLIALLLAWLPLAGRADDFEYGPRPAQSVFDPKGIVDPAVAKEISTSLDHIRETEFVDVMVVVLDDIGDAPPEHVANQFATAWCKTPIHAVVLHVPGNPDGPWIVPAGKLTDYLKPEIIYTAMSAAEDRAAREPDDTRKVKAAATEAADRLRFWMSTAINRTEFLKDARSRIRMEQETKARQRQIAMLTAAALAIPVLVGISALIYLLRKPSARRFPNANPPRRLGAPHAGGNHATLSLAPPAKK